ncbi:TPA: protein YchT [Escherichia coli]
MLSKGVLSAPLFNLIYG